MEGSHGFSCQGSIKTTPAHLLVAWWRCWCGRREGVAAEEEGAEHEDETVGAERWSVEGDIWRMCVMWNGIEWSVTCRERMCVVLTDLEI